MVTDNGSVFTSEEFKSFLEAAHSTSSPYHPASNGLAERAVHSFKQSMRKATGSIESRLSRFLFTYCLTPHTTTAQSPAELLFKRRPRSRLDILVPSVEQVVGRRQEYQKMSHDVHSSTCVFDVGNSVFVKDFRKQWLPGKIVEILGPVSARIKLLNGEFHRRHFDHIRIRQVLDQDCPAEVSDDSNTDDWTASIPSPVVPPAVDSNDTTPTTVVNSSPTVRRSTRQRVPPDRWDPSFM